MPALPPHRTHQLPHHFSYRQQRHRVARPAATPPSLVRMSLLMGSYPHDPQSCPPHRASGSFRLQPLIAWRPRRCSSPPPGFAAPRQAQQEHRRLQRVDCGPKPMPASGGQRTLAGGQGAHLNPSVLSPLRRERRAAARAGLQSRQLPAHPDAARGGDAVVAHHPARTASEDRRQERAARPVDHLPDGRGRCAARGVSADPGRYRDTTTIAAGTMLSTGTAAAVSDRWRARCAREPRGARTQATLQRSPHGFDRP